MAAEVDRFDTVVVGAGTAGCVMAARLAERTGQRVLLLEAGAELRPARAPAAMTGANHLASAALAERWNHWATSTGHEYLGGRGVGGAAAINGMLCMWPPAADFDRLGTLGIEGWTASARQAAMASVQAAVAPTMLGRSRWGGFSRSFHQAAKACGVEAVGDHNTGADGVGSMSLAMRDGVRHSMVEAYLEPARVAYPEALTIGCEAQVERIVFDGATARAVELSDGTVIGAGRVVLTAGAIETPAVLLRTDLPAALAGIGANLHDHPVVAITVRLRSEARNHLPDALVSGCVLRTSTLEPSDTMMLPIDHLGGDPDDRSMAVLMVVLLSSRSRGTVTLDGGGRPFIERALYDDPFDAALLAAAVEQSRRILEATEAVEEVLDGPFGLDGPALLDWARAHPANIFHAAGTCRMGPDGSRGAVVDAHGRVFGTHGLWVADASVLPEPVHAPPMLSVAMVAEHLAARLDEA